MSPYMKLGWPVFLVFSLLFFALTLSAPYLRSIGYDEDARANYLVFTNFCHQIPERSFTVFGYPTAVCARCLGLYAGMLAGALLYPLLGRKSMPAGWVLLAAMAPLAVDGFASFVGLWDSGNTVRSATGFAFGLAIPYYVIPAVDRVLSAVFIRQRR